MCGICGVMSHFLSDNELEAFRDLMVVSTMRGSDGSGVLGVPERENRVEAIKSDGSGADLVMSAPFMKFLQGRKKILLGHCRWPTKGTLNLDDVHPHRAGHIVGVHNGTMLEVNGTTAEDKLSDSALLFKAFAETGVVETIENSRGAYALIWINERDQTLNFLRNTDRPLYFAWVGTQTPTTIYWASEKGMLEFVMNRRYFVKPTIKEFKPHVWMRYSMNMQGTIKYLDEMDLKPKTKHKEWTGWGEGWVETEHGVWMRKEEPVKETQNTFPFTPKADASRASTSVPSVPPGPGHNVRHLRDILEEQAAEAKKRPYRLPVLIEDDTVFETIPNVFWPRTALERFLKAGCLWCESVMNFDDYMRHRLIFATDSEYICGPCAANPEVNGIL